jgi:hypothetical protein
MWTIILSIVAIVVAGAAAYYAKRSADASDRSAAAAEAVDLRGRTPDIVILLDHPSEAPIENVIYRLRNAGPQDLDSVKIYRPRPPDGITYPLAVTGAGAGYAEDAITVGPLPLTKEARFTFCCGAAPRLPDFLVRIECASGKDGWTLMRPLPSPRPVRPPLGPAPAEVRDAIEAAREGFQEIVAHGGRDTPFFLGDERRDVGQSLQDNAGRVGHELRPKLEQIAVSWNQAFGRAPAGGNVVPPGEAPNPDRLRRYDEQVNVAHRGLEQCATALCLLNELESA